MTSHTPGPWRLWTGETDASVNVVNGEGEYVCLAGREAPKLDDKDRIRADARLIAAAPNLLTACRLALTRLDDGTEVSAAIAKHLRAAIAKAEGVA